MAELISKDENSITVKFTKEESQILFQMIAFNLSVTNALKNNTDAIKKIGGIFTTIQ
jgi:hypothetical protein